MVSELKNLGPKGRKHLVDVWGAYLPKYGDPPFHAVNHTNGANGNQYGEQIMEDEIEEDDEDLEDDEANSTAIEMKRNQVGTTLMKTNLKTH